MSAPDPQDVRDFYEERAALIEFDGGAPRRVAEIAAIKQTMAEFGLSRLQVYEIINKDRAAGQGHNGRPESAQG